MRRSHIREWIECARGKRLAICRVASPIPLLTSLLFCTLFSADAVAQDGDVWLDTQAGNSLLVDDSLFDVEEVEGRPAIVTRSKSTNIHSHYAAANGWGTSRISGQMRFDRSRAGMGITFLSKFPLSDHYYRLRNYSTKDFHIAPHGTRVKGDTQSGVRPQPDTWYSFVIEVQVKSDVTEIRAKIWDGGSIEPASWQINCHDASATRLREGTVGCWSMSRGGKYWRKIAVDGIELPLPGSLPDPTDPDELPVEKSPAEEVADEPSPPVEETPPVEESPPEDVADEPSPPVEEIAGDEVVDEPGATDIEPPSGTESVSHNGGIWLDTQAGNSLVVDDSLFDVEVVGGRPALVTRSTSTNIHSHYDVKVAWGSSRIAGQMRYDSSGAGVGITFLSGYPLSDQYYRLRNYSDKEFHIAPHGTRVAGDTQSGLRPRPNTWYSFVVEVQVKSDVTEIRAKIWDAGKIEPEAWQINCQDASATRLREGTVGCWSMSRGGKFWRDLAIDGEVISFEGPADVEIVSEVPPENKIPTVRIVSVLDEDRDGGVLVTLEGLASDEDSDLGSASCSWDFGDGSRATGARVEHLYSGDGLFVVSVSVVDDQGAMAEDRLELEISMPPAPYVATMDFEIAAAEAAGGYARVEDANLAHGGTFCLELVLAREKRTGDYFPGPFADLLTPLLLADEAHVVWYSRWNESLSLDAESLLPALDEYLVARPDSIDADQERKARDMLNAIASGPLRSLEADRWYQIRIDCIFSDLAGSTGSIAWFVDAELIAEVRGVSALDDSKALDLVTQILRYRVIQTQATLHWMDDIVVSSAPLQVD